MPKKKSLLVSDREKYGLAGKVGSSTARLISKLLKKHKNESRIKSNIQAIKSKMEELDNELESSFNPEAVQEAIRISKIGDSKVKLDEAKRATQEVQIFLELQADKKDLIATLNQIEKIKTPLDLKEMTDAQLKLDNLGLRQAEIDAESGTGLFGATAKQIEGWEDEIARSEVLEKKRAKKQEGGDVDNQMNALMPVEETSADEEDRDIESQMEELEAAKTSLPAEEDIIPDEQMEDKYLDFVISQSLSPEEETALMNKLEADPELSVMFDKIMDTAIEFSGSGPVEGPGSEVSDSIPARLSDGEFVFTSKAADQIGEERLQSMMEDAEAESDDVERQEIALGGAIEDKNTITKEIKNSMLSINPRLR